MSKEAIGLTDDDFEKIEDMVENGVRSYAKNGGARPPSEERDPTEVTCQNCGYVWNYLGQRSSADCPECHHNTPLSPARAGDITLAMCNAIREAARDGLSYTEVAETLSFLNGRRVARDHAVGRCSHSGGVDAVPLRRQSTTDVSPEECRDFRTSYESGRSVTEISRFSGRDEATVYRHIEGDCSHPKP